MFMFKVHFLGQNRQTQCQSHYSTLDVWLCLQPQKVCNFIHLTATKQYFSRDQVGANCAKKVENWNKNMGFFLPSIQRIKIVLLVWFICMFTVFLSKTIWLVTLRSLSIHWTWRFGAPKLNDLQKTHKIKKCFCQY